jgi:predicted esterase
MDPSCAVHVIAAPTHGRYLVRTPETAGPWPLLVGFHGYAENAERHLRALQQIPGTDGWLVAAVQALHPFYTREQVVVASWMTRQDRELAIQDNVAYVTAVIDALRHDYATRRPVVFAGFSQGVAMAYRAAARLNAAAIVALAGDVPPDVAVAGVTLPPVLIGRGRRDPSYTEAKHDADLATLRQMGVEVESCVFDGGHEWTPAFCEAAGEALRRSNAHREL